jgi:hypothetical protein
MARGRDEKPTSSTTHPQYSSNPIVSKQQRVISSFQNIFPPVPTKRHGANRFKTQPSRMCTREYGW